MVKTCLNPYSNGMLTQYLQLDGLITVGVLILILMECLLSKQRLKENDDFLVLILILMECLLSPIS